MQVVPRLYPDQPGARRLRRGNLKSEMIVRNVKHSNYKHQYFSLRDSPVPELKLAPLDSKEAGNVKCVNHLWSRAFPGENSIKVVQ